MEITPRGHLHADELHPAPLYPHEISQMRNFHMVGDEELKSWKPQHLEQEEIFRGKELDKLWK